MPLTLGLLAALFVVAVLAFGGVGGITVALMLLVLIGAGFVVRRELRRRSVRR